MVFVYLKEEKMLYLKLKVVNVFDDLHYISEVSTKNKVKSNLDQNLLQIN